MALSHSVASIGEKVKEEKVYSSDAEHSWSASGGPESSSAGGECVRRKKKFVPPKCQCGSYAILFQSCTSNNPNRLFLGCCNFKTSTPHCRYFAWLDEYVLSNVVQEPAPRGDLLQELVKLNQKILVLEKMMAEKSVENTANTTIKCWGFFFLLLGIVFAIGLLAAIRI